MKNLLYELCCKYETDKGNVHRYDVAYSQLLKPYLKLNRSIRLLEIGVASGASIQVWNDYFYKPQIFGIDIDPMTKKYESENCKIYIGDQANQEFLQEVIRQTSGKWDIVIDDGGHLMHQQQISYEVLWPHIVPGGMYVIEDLHTSLIRPRKWNPLHIPTTLDWLLEKARAQVTRRRRRHPAIMYAFSGEACFILKP